jgi:hypothetical protein
VKHQDAQGWFRDPFSVHEDRYFSAGQPTRLVRDGGVEAYDEPPDRPFVASDLVPATGDTEMWSGGSDLRRADDANLDGPYSAGAAKRAAMDSVTRTFPPF